MIEQTTFLVFRCADSLKEQVKRWAAKHNLNLSEACRELINMELNRDEAVIESVTYSTEYSRFLQSLGYIDMNIPSEELEQVATQYADYLHSGNREFK